MTQARRGCPAVAGWALPECGPLEEGTMEWASQAWEGTLWGEKGSEGAGGSKDFRLCHGRGRGIRVGLAWKGEGKCQVLTEGQTVTA